MKRATLLLLMTITILAGCGSDDAARQAIQTQADALRDRLGNLGMTLNALGYTLMAHPEVKSQHLCPEVVAYLEKEPEERFHSPA